MSNIKCPQCGLVNFASSAECKRCQYLLQMEDTQDYSKPQNDPFLSLEAPPLFSGAVKVLTAILALGTVALLFSRIFHPFGKDTTFVIAGLFMLVGMALSFFAGIWTLVRVFEQSVAWGLASLFIPFAGLFAIAKFWEKTRRSFVGQLISLGIAFAGYYMVDPIYRHR